MTDLEDFLNGAPLEYKGFDRRRKCTATLVSPTSVAVESRGKVAFATIPEGCAKALYHNLTRRPIYA